MTSTKLIRKLTDPLNIRVTQSETNITNLQNTSLVVNSNITQLTNDAQYQTLNQVDAKINDLIGAAPGTLDTLGEIASALADDDSAIAALVAQDTALGASVTALLQADAASGIEILTLQTEVTALKNNVGINRQTLTDDLALTVTSKRRQNLINTSGTVRAVSLPTTPVIDHEYEVINHPTSTSNITFVGETLLPTERLVVQYDGVEWVVI